MSVTTSNGPYMKRPFSTWGRPSHTTVSLARWLEVTFWWEREGKLGLDKDADVGRKGQCRSGFGATLGRGGGMKEVELLWETMEEHVDIYRPT